jgi:hypothetical protein
MTILLLLLQARAHSRLTPYFDVRRPFTLVLEYVGLRRLGE